MRVIGIIPARYASNRFPGKPLTNIAGKPMIQRVYEWACKVSVLEEVFVATDSRDIFDRVKKFNGRVIMTSVDCKTGTDRVAEAVKNIDCNIVVNIQGDEPLISPEVINMAITPLLEDKNIPMGTVVSRITKKKYLNNRNVVKVVLDKDNFALYFSRSIVPCPKGKISSLKNNFYYKHIGIYVYRKDFLLRFVDMPQTPLEKIEELEQLRALENGYKIKVVITDYDTISVDVPEDIKKVENAMRKLSGIKGEKYGY